jgi:hypothetical protein
VLCNRHPSIPDNESGPYHATGYSAAQIQIKTRTGTTVRDRRGRYGFPLLITRGITIWPMVTPTQRYNAG